MPAARYRSRTPRIRAVGLMRSRERFTTGPNSPNSAHAVSCISKSLYASLQSAKKNNASLLSSFAPVACHKKEDVTFPIRSLALIIISCHDISKEGPLTRVGPEENILLWHFPHLFK